MHSTTTLLETLRRNVSILGELAVRYGVETHPPRPADPPAVYSPEAVRLLLAPEMAHLAQEQFGSSCWTQRPGSWASG